MLRIAIKDLFNFLPRDTLTRKLVDILLIPVESVNTSVYTESAHYAPRFRR
jgi:hypothetical protein